ncbi:type IV secretion system protein [Selenomonas ruminantium]|uniref:type IV secretion system protein n=1 Tax=Selenomonas ruminantium TaxID=971 RepID=UPI0026ED07C5|nr:type IV secretion system protein [Selenomonas ruminantium]
MNYTPEKLEIEYFLGRFIQDTRSLPVDGEVYKQSWYEAYGYMTKDAAAAMSAEMEKQDRTGDFGKKRIKVTINSILSVNSGSDSYQANWTEEVWDLTTGSQKTVKMTGIFTITIIQGKDKKSLMENPLGIYVKDFSWSEENVANVSKEKAGDK